MRSSIKIILTLIVGISFYGCQKYLDVVPDNIATIEDAYKDRVSAQRALATCYNHIPRNGTRHDPGFAAGDDIGIHEFLDKGGQGDGWRQYHRELAVNGHNVTRPSSRYRQ